MSNLIAPVNDYGYRDVDDFKEHMQRHFSTSNFAHWLGLQKDHDFLDLMLCEFFGEFPCKVTINGDNELHSVDDKPALILWRRHSPLDIFQCWYLDGRIHRSSGPAIIDFDGTEYFMWNDHDMHPLQMLVLETHQMMEDEAKDDLIKGAQ